ncbi:type VI secretion system baseplate subunit TssF [Aquimarina longa]|uniref:type VI secretion system baseplate subunit TssF n=1 Tax=Aquimarina longa TaxID=1080221 RepID=UPI00078325A6|nr:type VI secretion system baseplate subunit TssF [Aquimarina longa]
MEIENKTQVKNRMIKKAASLWGVSPNEIESSFDPIVSLLIGACASEIAKISGEINNSQTRVTERLLQIMTPETLYGARPAHAIAVAEPTDVTINITPEHLFYYKKKIKTRNAEQEEQNLFFSAVQDTKLVDTHISHMICGTEMYEIEGRSVSNVPLTLKDTSPLPQSTIYLGIKTEHEHISLKDTSLFFELLDVQDTDLFYHHLQHANIYYNDTLIDVVSGYYNSRDSDRIQIESIFSLKPNKTKNIESQVKKAYERHFLTIKSNISLQNEGKIPQEFTKFIDIKNHEELHEYNWIKVVFPRIIDNTVLKNIYSTFNAFPILNRKLESVSFQLKDYIDIIPLSTMDLFLDIKTVINTEGKTYKLRENDSEHEEKGTYIIRRDNVGKLDSRKAKEYLLHLIGLLKDESAGFSIYGNDFLQTNINELNQNIAALEKKLFDMDKATVETNYVSIKPYNKKDSLLLEYWTTNGEKANQIKPGSTLEIYKGTDLKQKGGFFLTPTFQGKNNLTMDERLYTYRRALLSRNRIVTKEDVKALCYELCGDKIEKITIRKGFKTNIKANKGLIPSIEILLTVSKRIKTSELEWESIKSNILSVLEKQSLNVFPYYITIIN